MRRYLREMRNLVFLAFIGSFATTQATAAQTTATDILLIVADDMGPYLGCYGDPIAKTPVMDKLAGQGVRFDNAWVPQASCSPSRSAIFTGLYPHQNGQVGLAHLGFSMSGNFPSIPSLLNEAGYYTGIIGKVHVKPASSLPFKYVAEYNKFDKKDMRAYAKRVGHFLDKAGDKPVFLDISYSDPHRPFSNKHKGFPENPVTTDEVKPMPFMAGLEKLNGVLKQTAGYYNGIMRLDAGVGLVLEEFEKAGRLDNTLIIVIGDHGAPFGRAKVTCYNPGMHIPFIVKWPGVSTTGTVSQSLVSTIDLLPTFLDVAGAAIPENLPGHSIRPAVADSSHDLRKYMFGEFTAHLPADYFPRRTARTERFQLIENLFIPEPFATPGVEGELERNAVKSNAEMTSEVRVALKEYMAPPRFELFDLEKDPDNFHNLADDPEFAEVQQELKTALDDWRIRTDDPLLKPGEYERLGKVIDGYKREMYKTRYPNGDRKPVKKKQ